MAVTHMVKGRISPILYWENKHGKIMLVPHSEVLTMERLRRYMDKLGFELRAAETLKQAEDLQGRLQEQMKSEQQLELARDQAMTLASRKARRDRLYARSNSADCSVFERELIKVHLSQETYRQDIFNKKFTQEVGHLDALEFDNPDAHLHDALDKTNG